MKISNIRVIEKIGKKPGKTIVILAGVHGDEVCGVKAFDELIPKLEIEKGKVIFIYANLEAQKKNKRFVEANLNRCFFDKQPESIRDTLEGRTAREIMPYLNEADILLDLHSSRSSSNLCYLICEEDCLNLALALPPKKIITGIHKTHKGGTDGYMSSKGKPGICIECGLHKSKESLEMAKTTILNLLKKAGNISAAHETYDNKEIFETAYLYRNKNGAFELARKFKDFEEASERTLVGFDGNEKVFIKKGDVMMFPDDPEKIGQECFMIIRRKLK